MDYMTNEEMEQWMLLFSSSPNIIPLKEYTVSDIKRELNMDNTLDFDITDTFWTDNENKYLKGDLFSKKIPMTNLRERLNAVEISEKNKLFNHLIKRKYT